ncbi:hypothetical protein PRK78_005784 [Emydomyces testavorans]|uniref:Uncharacterized protein n=1 Tax=Emydomyces testavorans TaxID=2070801 RepID=A0AAF0IMY4_9EURO|nr:hypothetical protein PRK78_005784 [Emydomyces testavorans]
MQLKLSVLALGAIAGAFGAAVPAESPKAPTSVASSINPSTGGTGTLALTHLYFCKNVQFGNPCVNEEFQTGECRARARIVRFQ